MGISSPRMLKTPDETFMEAPVGRFCVVGSAFLWCASPSLGGAFLWSKQSEAETRHILEIFDHGLRSMSPSFDVVLDTRGVEAVDPLPLGILFKWMVARTGDLSRRLRLQACIIRSGPIGLLLTGLMPVTGQTQPYRIFTSPAEAFTAVAGAAGAALCAEVDGIAEQVRGVPREVRVTRELLEARLDVPIEEVSRTLGLSPRSLQRALGRHGTTFHDEVVAMRLAFAQALLRSGDLKLADVGARVGISERALGLLFRAKTGLTPAEWRKQHRG
jgi:AraC-like DNA-binding protein